MRLASEPSATVTVTIGGTSGTDLTLSTSSLTFTTSNWSTAQPVTVSAGQDDDAVDDDGDADAHGVWRRLRVGHARPAGDRRRRRRPDGSRCQRHGRIFLSESSLNPPEGGSESYTVTLGSQPSASVTVAIGGTSGTDLTLSTSSLTFTTSNWSTAQPVTVSAGQDDDAVDDDGDADAHGLWRRLRVGHQRPAGDRRRRRDGRDRAVEVVAEPVGGRGRGLHGEAGERALGNGDGDHRGHVGDGPDPEHVEPDVHGVELERGAAGDGERGPGRRRGRRRRRR